MSHEVYSLLRAKYERCLLRGDWTPGRYKRAVDALDRAEQRESERRKARRALTRQLKQSLEEGL